MKIRKEVLALAVLGIVLQGCAEDDSDRSAVPPASPDTPENPQNPDNPDDPADPGTPSTASAVFQPSARTLSAVPFPSDVFFYGTVDGSINVPGLANSDSAITPTAELLSDPLVALNTMDGFATTAHLAIRFSGPVDPDSLREGIRIFETDIKNPLAVDHSPVALPQILGSPADSAADSGELEWDAHYVAEVVSDSTVVVTLVKPLHPFRTHIVAVTDALRTPDGNPVSADPEYVLLQSSDSFVFQSDTTTPCDYSDPPDSLFNCTDLNPALGDSMTLDRALELEGFRQITNNHLAAIADYDGTTLEETAAGIILSYSVSTQHVGNALEQAKLQVDASSPGVSVAATGMTSPGGQADLYAGTLSGIHQYLDPAAANTSVWEASEGMNLVMYNGFIPATKVTDHSIPVLVSVPDIETNAACTEISDLPVVIFQHTLESNRGALASLADSLAGVCAVGVAIDLPKHGILPSDPEQGGLSNGTAERLVPSEAATAESPLGSCVASAPLELEPGVWRCPSADGFINLDNLGNWRDTVRQAVVDLQSLYVALSQGELTADELGITGKTLGGEIHFVGHGFGATVGVPFAAHELELTTVTLNAVGGGIARMLDGSPTFEPQLVAAAGKRGIVKPSIEYELLLTVAQTLLDNTDPLVFTKSAGLAGPPNGKATILAQEVVGDGFDADPGIPNNVYGDRFGPAWELVAQTGQDGFLAGQNPATVAVVLAGMDAVVQGTTFVPAAATLSPEEAAARGPLTALGMDEYKGLGLTEMNASACDERDGLANGTDLVRFTAGGADSLLDASADAGTTALMQAQVARYIASGGTVLVCDPNLGTAEQVMRDF